MRILVMDADRVTRGMLSDILKGGGHQVMSVANGVEGLQIMREDGADAVVADLFLPDQDGLATIAMVRKEFPQVHVVAVTEETQYLSLENARATASIMGADAFILKPIDHLQVLDAVQRGGQIDSE